MEGKEYGLILSRRALSSLDDAAGWYEQQREELGMEFLMAFEEAADFLRKNPKIYQKVYREFRKSSIKRFPYAIFFAVDDPKRVVRIVAVMHEKGVTTSEVKSLKMD